MDGYLQLLECLLALLVKYVLKAGALLFQRAHVLYMEHRIQKSV